MAYELRERRVLKLVSSFWGQLQCDANKKENSVYPETVKKVKTNPTNKPQFELIKTALCRTCSSVKLREIFC